MRWELIYDAKMNTLGKNNNNLKPANSIHLHQHAHTHTRALIAAFIFKIERNKKLKKTVEAEVGEERQSK